MAKPLRLFIGLIILILPAFFGWHYRNPMIIPILGAIYVPLYIFGKMGAWQALGAVPSRSAIIKALPLTFVIQSLLVGAFYLIGLGLGTLFAANDMAPALEAWDGLWLAAFAAVTVPMSIYIAYAERHIGTENLTGAISQSEPTSDRVRQRDDEDFVIHDRIVTPETFYKGLHFSHRDAAGIALQKIVDYDGEKPKRAPKRASETMIAQAEVRLGVRLPETLRNIYRIQDGGGLPTYYVPKHDGAPLNYENWITAFADDYNDLKPLDMLMILQHDYDEHFDPEYDDEDDKKYWISGADKLVILTVRTGYGTALDYRRGPEPGVLLFDHGKDPGEMELATFDSFDTFLSSIREVESDPRRNDPERQPKVFGGPPDPLDADGFWASGNPGPTITTDMWEKTGNALGVTLPAALYPFYKAADGGQSKFKVALAEDETESPHHPFPTGPYIKAGAFLRSELFISLATLSDRLDFIDNRTPWRDLFDHPDKLIVISAAFDKALLLDYRQGAEPSVLAVSDLDDPDSAILFPSVDVFVARLRRFDVEKFAAKDEIGDARISSRRADTTTFWLEDDSRKPVSDEVAKAFIEKWGYTDHGLPAAIKAIYAAQNGGMVRFRFAPPQFVNPHGYKNYDATAKKWVDAFPDGLLPMENWQHFTEWRIANGLALDQPLYDFTDRVKAPYDGDMSDTKLNLFVIGDHTSSDLRMVTVLDLSKAPFVSNRNLMTLFYDKTTDTFATVFGPIMVDNIHHGLFQMLRAHKSEL